MAIAQANRSATLYIVAYSHSSTGKELLIRIFRLSFYLKKSAKGRHSYRFIKMYMHYQIKTISIKLKIVA